MRNFISKRRIPFLIADVVLISFSVVLAFAVRFEGFIPEQYFLNIFGLVISALFFSIPTFYFFKLYSFSWAFVSTQELISLIKAISLSFLFLAAAFLLLRDYAIFSGFPRSTLIMSYFFIFIFVGGIRFAKRIYLQIKGKNKEGKERILIVGAGGAGEQILRSIMAASYTPYLPIGFIDDSPAKRGMLIHGLKILGAINEIPKIAKEYGISNLIIALPSAGSEIIKRAVEEGRKAGLINPKVLPPIGELLSGDINVGIGVLREIEMEDLLGRETAALDKKLVEDFIGGKKVLITGAAGSIGSELCRQIARFKPSLLLLLDQDETGIFNISGELKDNFSGLNIESIIADICDEIKVEQVFNNFKPDIVFHAAAYKHVPLMESQPDAAVKNNIFGMKKIADLSLKYGAKKFIFISTDKAVNPSSVMGATKRIGEMICRALNNKGSVKFISVRFGNVLNSRGSVIPVFKGQIKNGKIKITHKDMRRYFMVTSEACLLVMEAGAMGQGGEIFVLDMGSPIKIIDLAKELIKRSGFDADQIKIEYSGPRPGEKLSEEILTAEEGTITTKNQKIFIAKLSDFDSGKLYSSLGELGKTADLSDSKNIKEILKEIIPSYNFSNN